MAKWTVKEEGRQITLSYTNSLGEQDCGSCKMEEKDQLMGWLFLNRAGADAGDMVVMDSKKYHVQAQAWA